MHYIEDETGKVKLCLWNVQANNLSKVDAIQINIRQSTFKGEKQLSLGKIGAVSVLQPKNKAD